MSARKTNKKAQMKCPPLRSKKGEMRDCFIQFRVTRAEKEHAQKAFGKKLSHAIRSFLFGSCAPEPSVLEDDFSRLFVQALYAHFKVCERVYTHIERGDVKSAIILRSELEKNHSRPTGRLLFEQKCGLVLS